MRNQKLISTFVLVVAALMIAGLAAGVSAQQRSTLDRILDQGVLKVGIMLDWRPGGFYDENGDPAGYEVDVAKKVAEHMGVDLRIIETPGPSRIPALKAKRVDITFAALAITPERAKAVAFARPYMSNSQTILTKEDSDIKEFEDIAGKRIGTVRGTTPESNLMDMTEDWDNPPRYTSYDSNADQLLALRQGKVDAIAEASIFFNRAMEKNPGAYRKVGPPFYEELCAPAVRPDDHELLNYLNTILWQMIVLSDEMNEINEKYYAAPLDEKVYYGLK